VRVPIIRGVIDRRILINYRVEPTVLASLLPQPFRPKLVDGYGMAGVCLIRLKSVRPRFVPKVFGVGSENAAHRIAVEWERNGELQEGVFIPRRDTSSRFNTLVGGRLFPGLHHHARFQVQEQDGHYSVTLDSDDNTTHLSVEAHATDEFPKDSVFESLDEASEFFQRGSLGFSTTLNPGNFDGLELRSFNWSVRPLAVEKVDSSFFTNCESILSDSVAFDSALLMKNVEHEWLAREPICSN
jgi:hypothetical protein